MSSRPTSVPASRRARNGKVLVMFAVSLPMLLGVAGLVIDGGLLMLADRRAQQAADAAATMAAHVVMEGGSVATATSVAEDFVHANSGLGTATVTVEIPPVTGPRAGDGAYAEVVVEVETPTYLTHLFSGSTSSTVSTRAVAGAKPATSPVGAMVLDPSPESITIDAIPGIVVTAPPLSIGGLEVAGLGRVNIDGAVVVNNEWGGVDRWLDPCGLPDSLRRAVVTLPGAPLEALRTRDLFVVGGVDHPSKYKSIDPGKPCPLRAGVAPTADPLIDLPVPTTSSDPMNVDPTQRGSVLVVAGGLPLLSDVVLNPGVYESISILAGNVTFRPGVYVVRSRNPLTGISVNVVAGRVIAEGVMFYITDDAAYSGVTGGAGAGDGETEPPPAGVSKLVPSVIIDTGLLGSRFTGLDSPGSPFDGMLLFQRRQDRRPIVMASVELIANPELSGRVYAKWGSVLLAGRGEVGLSIAAGTVRFVNALELELNPTDPFDPPREVYLVE